ncbi:hypothetical protein Hypma_008438 [Hypsizygus marmoreus]|uniref:Fe2OG dioxygenase domain-containing protein n=1 Tax=Hypsizygus marmoreus TaxID=39966 RepID=A0A369K0G3_HYPMA|nr:hypothetical protein Hypma_008438 [Hypsizygus marmoreus]
MQLLTLVLVCNVPYAPWISTNSAVPSGNTRSGAIFSPFELPPGNAVHATTTFSIRDALRQENADTGWIGKRPAPLANFSYELAELTGPIFGMKLVNWDGYTPTPLLDAEGRVICNLAGQPKGDEWKREVVDSCASTIKHASRHCDFKPPVKEARRGRFAAAAIGISFGGGQKRPGNLRNSASQRRALEEIHQSTCFRRLAGFASKAFATYAPRVFQAYDKNLNDLTDNHWHLRHNFPGSVFAAATVNFGPRTVTKPHTDRENMAWGWCAITALGDFDPDTGGHLVLWDLGLVIRFPPGATILIPSALLLHSNVQVKDGESRYSFTQYTAGGLFRWVYNGFCTDKSLMESATPEEIAMREEERAQRWEKGLAMFSTSEEFW